MGINAGPLENLFKSFQEKWDDINKSKYKITASVPHNGFILGSDRTLRMESKMLLLEKRPRGDYPELLELIILILGEKICIAKNWNLKPGAVHKARWM